MSYPRGLFDKGFRMNGNNLKWDEMCRALESYKEKHGHANVPAKCKENPQLGRWVAMQRYRRKVGELSAGQIETLDKEGFIWAPTDAVWSRMFDKLVQFKKKRGHCDVPSSWPADPHLSNWVANQRHRKKMGTLSPERSKRLESTGFSWAVYGKVSSAQEGQPQAAPVKAVTKARRENEAEERLYLAGIGAYIQYNGCGPLPPRLDRYVSQHKGEFPPYIPLPKGPVRFRVSEEGARLGRAINWTGKGMIPEDVREFVNEHGVLPPHDY